MEMMVGCTDTPTFISSQTGTDLRTWAVWPQSMLGRSATLTRAVAVCVRPAISSGMMQLPLDVTNARPALKDGALKFIAESLCAIGEHGALCVSARCCRSQGGEAHGNAFAQPQRSAATSARTVWDERAMREVGNCEAVATPLVHFWCEVHPMAR